MSGLTDAERRGARLLALLLVLGTARDLWQARHPQQAPEVEWGAVAAEPAPGGPAPDSAGAPEAPRLLDLNTASAAELDRLPGIGPVLAGRIVEHRQRHGGFRRVDELLTVPGIGPKLLERMRPALREPAARARAPGALHGTGVQDAR